MPFNYLLTSLKANVIISFIVLFLLLLISVEADSQRREREGRWSGNRTQAILQQNDSLPADTLLSDSLSVDTVPKKKDGLDAPVSYEASDSIVFTQDGYAHLFGDGKVNYPSQHIELTAEVISMNMDSSTVYAHGVEDSVGVMQGLPVFKDGDTPYETNTIRYNFKSKKGLISNVVSQQGEGYVTGNNAKKGSGDELYMKKGRYTTCDNHEHPHFYMQMTYAKVRPKKNVVTGPAYLVVEDVPLPLAVPFFFFPFSSSYQSGFLMPTYMDDSSRGFGLTDGGYYFAISDQMDLQLTADIFTKGSWALRAQSNYVKRYKFSGSFQFDYQVTKTGDKGLSDYMVAKDFKVVWSHRQDAKANPNSTFSASVNFSTSSYERTNIDNLYNSQLMSQNTKTSSVSYSRNFFNNLLSISATANIAQTMRDSSISVTLPDLNISLSTVYPFRRKHRVGDEKWYEKINLRYTGRMTNSIQTKDNLLFKSNLVRDWENAMQHNIPISATFTLFNYFNVTPSFNYTERWYPRKITKGWDQHAQQEIETDTTYGFHRVYDYSASIGINTKIYGMYKPILFPKKEIQIRHVITPSISFSGSPNFGSSHYGYYDSYVRTDRNGLPVDTVRYSYYQDQPFFSGYSGKSGTVTFDLSNNLEMKYRDKNDSIRKISLIDELGLGISYNFAAKEQPWSDLDFRLRMKITKNYTLSMSSRFATYAYEFDENGNVYVGNRTEWSYGRFGRWSGYGTSFSWTLNNDTWNKIRKLFRGGDDEESGEKSGEGDAAADGEQSASTTDSGKKTKQKAEVDEDGYQVFKMPWSINFSTGFNISEDTSKPINRKRMRYPYKFSLNALNINGNIKISNKWSVNFNSGYDFNAKEITQTTFNITRDLHCFSMSASIAPFGRWKYYNFTIRANASILQDLKYEQRSQTQSNIQWY